jgi:hypothetical protein
LSTVLQSFIAYKAIIEMKAPPTETTLMVSFCDIFL